jgi:hypothetical protein
MSKISYCSLEEAWGDSYKNNNNNDNDTNNINYKTNENNENKKYYLNKNSELQREEFANNMNGIERNSTPENNNIVEYNKYRLNPNNTVKKNNYDQSYTPFNESIEKKFLQDKLNFLENEFRKYKHLFEKSDKDDKNVYNRSSEEIIESFKNNTEPDTNYKSTDIIDLILLIIIGLIIILVMNSIFTIGKSIGLRNRPA